MELNKIHNLSVPEGLKILPDSSINCCVTSPPYYGLRDYGNSEQIGLEETPELFVQKLVEVFREVKRVLKKDGTLWLNLGDSYAGSGKGIGSDHGKAVFTDKEIPKTKWRKSDKNNDRNGEWCNRNGIGYIQNLKPKDLIGIPWLVAFALRADGWYLRQDIIWNKPNPMPESVTDRCTKAHEYIFLLSKSSKYYYDQNAIKTPVSDDTILRMGRGVSENNKNVNGAPGQTPHSLSQPRDNIKYPGRSPRKGIDTKGCNQGSEKGIPAMAINGRGVNGHSGYFNKEGNLIGGGFANKKSVWTVTTKPFSEAHFATFPEDLILPCILAGCPEGGIVLDPFMGAGTTGLVAVKNNRNYIGFEINPEYIKIAEKRILEPVEIKELGYAKTKLNKIQPTLF